MSTVALLRHISSSECTYRITLHVLYTNHQLAHVLSCALIIVTGDGRSAKRFWGWWSKDSSSRSSLNPRQWEEVSNNLLNHRLPTLIVMGCFYDLYSSVLILSLSSLLSPHTPFSMPVATRQVNFSGVILMCKDFMSSLRSLVQKHMQCGSSRSPTTDISSPTRYMMFGA